jgi:cyclohexanone monooxygenase
VTGVASDAGTPRGSRNSSDHSWVQPAAGACGQRVFPRIAIARVWWVGANIPGKPRTLYPYVGGVGPFRAICQDIAEKGYEGLVLTRH